MCTGATKVRGYVDCTNISWCDDWEYSWHTDLDKGNLSKRLLCALLCTHAKSRSASAALCQGAPFEKFFCRPNHSHHLLSVSKASWSPCRSNTKMLSKASKIIHTQPRWDEATISKASRLSIKKAIAIEILLMPEGNCNILQKRFDATRVSCTPVWSNGNVENMCKIEIFADESPLQHQLSLLH